MIDNSPYYFTFLNQDEFLTALGSSGVQVGALELKEPDLMSMFPTLNVNELFASKCETDIRPRILDNDSGIWMLIDSGAMISVVPRANYPNSVVDYRMQLEAVNGSKFDTYGMGQIQFTIGNMNFRICDHVCSSSCPDRKMVLK